MEAKQFEAEEFLVAVAVGHAFEVFDLVVGALQGSGGDGVIVPCQNAVAEAFQGLGEVVEDGDAGAAGATAPAVEAPLGGGLIALIPELPEVLLEVIGGGQGGVELQGFLKPPR